MSHVDSLVTDSHVVYACSLVAMCISVCQYMSHVNSLVMYHRPVFLFANMFLSVSSRVSHIYVQHFVCPYEGNGERMSITLHHVVMSVTM